MFMHDGKILVCGGGYNEEKCLQLIHGTWKKHSTLNEKRIRHSTVTTQIGTFIFGGFYSDNTYEYLPKDSVKWLKGRTIIPKGFYGGCAIAVKSDQEIWLIGGQRTERRILSFDVKNRTFQVLPWQLNVKRLGHRCTFIPNTNKIMVTGGKNSGSYLDSTEIIDPENGSVTMASPMKSKRSGHGIGVITINGEDRLAVFGGEEQSDTPENVELYNHRLERWETTDIILKEPKSYFGFMSLKLSDVISKL